MLQAEKEINQKVQINTKSSYSDSGERFTWGWRRVHVDNTQGNADASGLSFRLGSKSHAPGRPLAGPRSLVTGSAEPAARQDKTVRQVTIDDLSLRQITASGM